MPQSYFNLQNHSIKCTPNPAKKKKKILLFLELNKCLPLFFVFYSLVVGSDITDEEVVRAGSSGFIGCLSSVLFNQAAPLKAALQNKGSSAVSIHGRLEESDCGAQSSINTHITTHTGSGTALVDSEL